MGLFRKLCIVSALLSAVVTDSFMMADNTAGSTSTTRGLAEASSANEGKSGESAGEVPLLPESDPNADIPTIKLGETIRFEEFGPIILNTDGSTRRISNWEQLTEKEKEVTWRRISKRNEERRLMLLQQQEEQLAAEEAAKAEEL